MNFVTIPPKIKKCDDQSYGWLNVLNGHCYDKNVSGHFSIVYLLTLVLLGKGIISVNKMIAVNVMFAWFILAARAHYTIDILSAIIVCHLVVYHNKFPILTLHDE